MEPNGAFSLTETDLAVSVGPWSGDAADSAYDLETYLVLVERRLGTRLDTLAAELGSRLRGQLEAAMSDLRRTHNAALEVQVDASATTLAAAVDTKASLESRAGVSEDALRALTEQVGQSHQQLAQQLQVVVGILDAVRQDRDPARERRLRAEASTQLEAALAHRDRDLLAAVSEVMAGVSADRIATQLRLLELEVTTGGVLSGLHSLEARQAESGAATGERFEQHASDLRGQVAAVRSELARTSDALTELLPLPSGIEVLQAGLDTLAAELEAQGRPQNGRAAGPSEAEAYATLLAQLEEHRVAVAGQLADQGSTVNARLDRVVELLDTTGAPLAAALTEISAELRRSARTRLSPPPSSRQVEERSAGELVELRVDVQRLAKAVARLAPPSQPKLRPDPDSRSAAPAETPAPASATAARVPAPAKRTRVTAKAAGSEPTGRKAAVSGSGSPQPATGKAPRSPAAAKPVGRTAAPTAATTEPAAQKPAREAALRPAAAARPGKAAGTTAKEAAVTGPDRQQQPPRGRLQPAERRAGNGEVQPVLAEQRPISPAAPAGRRRAAGPVAAPPPSEPGPRITVTAPEQPAAPAADAGKLAPAHRLGRRP